MVVFFLSTRLSLSDFTLNPLVNARVTLKIFTLKSGMYAVLVHVNWYNLPSLFWYPFQSPRSNPVIVLLFPVLTNIFTSLRFIIFSGCSPYVTYILSRQQMFLNFLVDYFILAR